MGDRANIVVKQGGNLPPVFLYTHWGGYSLPESLRVALAKRWRWNDNAYLTRIIFDTMSVGHHDQETGYGISTGIEDNSYPFLEVDPDDRMVRLFEEARDEPDGEPRTPLAAFTFEEYVAMEEAMWEAIAPGQGEED